MRYINVLDPTNMCYYVSEILDAERDGPLFMVIGSIINISALVIYFVIFVLHCTTFEFELQSK